MKVLQKHKIRIQTILACVVHTMVLYWCSSKEMFMVQRQIDRTVYQHFLRRLH